MPKNEYEKQLNRSQTRSSREDFPDRSRAEMNQEKNLQQLQSDNPPQVHVFRADTDQGAMYKIGFSRNPKRRRADLSRQCGYPLVIVGTCAGTAAKENALHKEFAAWRTHGEWFRLLDEQVAVLKRRLEGEFRVIQLPTAGKKQMLLYRTRKQRNQIAKGQRNLRQKKRDDALWAKAAIQSR